MLLFDTALFEQLESPFSTAYTKTLVCACPLRFLLSVILAIRFGIRKLR